MVTGIKSGALASEWKVLEVAARTLETLQKNTAMSVDVSAAVAYGEADEVR